MKRCSAAPRLRSEIVWGKLGAVTTFSMLTAILNAGSMLVTSSFVFRQMGIGGGGGIGAPPIVPDAVADRGACAAFSFVQRTGFGRCRDGTQ